MTTAKFLRLLHNVRDQFDWTLTADTGRHAERRATSRFHIRGSPKTDTSLVFGPLQALCYVRTGKVFESEAWSEAAATLEIDLPEAAALVAAANDRTWAWNETLTRRELVEHLLSLRKELIEALGLSPETGQ